MSYQMDPNKSGVLIYFDPMQEAADALDDERLGKLTRAIINYANPSRMTEPEFQDDALSKMWIFVKSSIVRDDKTYRVKSAKKRYAAFCRYSKERGYDPPISRDVWDNLGQPSFTQWEKEQLHTTAMQTVATQSSALQCMPTPYAPSTPSSLSPSPSNSFSSARARAVPTQADAGSAAERPAAAFDPLPPSLEDALTKWTMHWEQIKRQTFPQSSRSVLRAEFRTYAEDYGAEAVLKLVDTAVSSAWKTIPWDKLEQWRKETASGNGEASDDELWKYAEEHRRKREKGKQ